jgi:hypothetical protein
VLDHERSKIGDDQPSDKRVESSRRDGTVFEIEKRAVDGTSQYSEHAHINPVTE